MDKAPQHPTAQTRLPRRRRRSPVVLMVLLAFWSACIGWALSLSAYSQTPPPPSEAPAAISTVDPVPPVHQLGQQLYLENCSSCHIAIPPAVLPTETWRRLLQDPQHYGQQITPPVDPGRLLIWNYLQIFSRPLKEGEEVPYRLERSRYFKALHPTVDLPRPVTLTGCVSCHPGAGDFDFRRLADAQAGPQAEP